MNYRKEEKAKYFYGVVVFAQLGVVSRSVGGVRRNEKLHGPLAAKNRTEFSFTQIAK